MNTTSFQAAEQKARSAEEKCGEPNMSKEFLKASIYATELYMKALNLAPDAREKARLETKCQEMLLVAESTKQKRKRLDGETDRAQQPTALAPGPSSNRKLTTREEILLLEGSRLNGFVFPPWKGVPKDEEFVLKEGEELFTDSPPLKLSDVQMETFAGWKRPGEALGTYEFSDVPTKMPGPSTNRFLKKSDLVQDMISDCSVVASLCALSARGERGHSRVFSSVLFPYNHKEMRPVISPSSKYILRLYFNGCHRKVVVDDLLPTSTDSRIFHVTDRRDPTHLWPALVEKAYLKVRGGYDFPGSNSGTDLSVLTGWIPEQVFLHDEHVMAEELWSRVFDAFESGDVLVTIGTGKLSNREQRHLGLAAEHDYAVLDMKETDGVKEFLIKNPWSDGEVYKGRSSYQATLQSLNETTTSNPTGVGGPSEQDSMAPGTFWMDLGGVFLHFENLYLNWNPGLFSHRQDHHFTWDLSSSQTISSQTTSFHTNPQFSIHSTRADTLWILLNRHFRTGDYLPPSGPTTHTHTHGFISLYIFSAGGQRVLLPDRALLRGPYVDSPNTLLRLPTTANTTSTIVIAAQSLPGAKHTFTLSVFSSHPTTLSPSPDPYPNISQVSGNWTRPTAGGNSDTPTYLANPQYRLSLPLPTALALLLSTPDPTTPIHLKIFYTNGTRMHSPPSARSILAHSGPYRPGTAALETRLDQGSYTVIPSTFEPGTIAPFTLMACVATTAVAGRARLSVIPGEESGRLVSRAQGVAVLGGAVGRLLAPLVVQRLVSATFVVERMGSRGRGLGGGGGVRVSVELSQGPYKQCLGRSGDGDGSGNGEDGRLEDLVLEPAMCNPERGGLWLVLETVGGRGGVMSPGEGGEEEGFEVKVLAEERVEIGVWGTGDG